MRRMLGLIGVSSSAPKAFTAHFGDEIALPPKRNFAQLEADGNHRKKTEQILQR